MWMGVKVLKSLIHEERGILQAIIESGGGSLYEEGGKSDKTISKTPRLLERWDIVTYVVKRKAGIVSFFT